MAVSAIAGILCVAAGICWLINRESKRFTPLPYVPNPAIEDISWMGKGTVNSEDTCLVIENNVNLSHYVNFKVIPGKYVFLQESRERWKN